MSSRSFLAALGTELRPLTSYDVAAVTDFCSHLGDDRYELALSPSRLLHPAGPTCVGAFLGDTLVGLGRLSPPGPGRTVSELLVVVRTPWRRAGLGSRLVRAIVLDEGVRDLGQATIEVARSNRAALGLGRACGMTRTELPDGRIRLSVRLGRPILRVA